jgi:hypothetical protein
LKTKKYRLVLRSGGNFFQEIRGHWIIGCYEKHRGQPLTIDRNQMLTAAGEGILFFIRRF